MRPHLHLAALTALLLLSGPSAYAGPPLSLEKEAKPVITPLDDGWRFTLALPAWIAGTRGDAGVNGSVSHSVTGFNEVVNKVDMTGGARVEAQKGKFGIRGDFLYTSISDGVGVGGAIRKLDIQADQMFADLGVSWRLLSGPRGYLDAIGGVRYTYMYEQIKLQGNGDDIAAAANRLALAGTIVRAGLRAELIKLQLEDQRRFGRPSIGGGEIVRLARELRDLRGTTAERAARIDQVLRKALNGRVSRTDQWFDPYFGLRGRYNFTAKLYFTARADISPFDVGCDFAWQASAGFGWQLTPRVTYELVYRALDMDYRHDGLIYDTTMYGPEGTLSISF